MARNQNNRPQNPLASPFMTRRQIEAEARRLADLAAGPRGAIITPYERADIGLEAVGRAYGEALVGAGEAQTGNIAAITRAGGGSSLLAGAAAAASQATQAAPAGVARAVSTRRGEIASEKAKAESEYEQRRSGYVAEFSQQLRQSEMEKAASLAEMRASEAALDFKYKELESEESRFFAQLAQEAALAREKMENDLEKARISGDTLSTNDVYKSVSDWVNARVDKTKSSTTPTGFTGTVIFKYKPTPTEIASGVRTDAQGFALSDPVALDWKDINDLNSKVAAQYPGVRPGSVQVQTQEVRETTKNVYTYSLPALKRQAISIAMAGGLTKAQATRIVNQIFSGISRG